MYRLLFLMKNKNILLLTNCCNFYYNYKPTFKSAMEIMNINLQLFMIVSVYNFTQTHFAYHAYNLSRDERLLHSVDFQSFCQRGTIYLYNHHNGEQF